METTRQMISLSELKEDILYNDTLKELFEIRQSNSQGGKAGKGRNETTSFMLSSEKLYAFSYFSYIINDYHSLQKAIVRAHRWISKQLIKAERCEYCGGENCKMLSLC